MKKRQEAKMIELLTPLVKKALNEATPLDSSAKENIAAMEQHLSSLGIKIKISDLSPKGKLHELKVIDINPKSVGIMAPMFKKIELEISAVLFADFNGGRLVLQYNYEHPTGSNGYTVRCDFVDGKLNREY